MSTKTRIKQIEKLIKSKNPDRKGFIHIVQKSKKGYMFDNSDMTVSEYEAWKMKNDPKDLDTYIILTRFDKNDDQN